MDEKTTKLLKFMTKCNVAYILDMIREGADINTRGPDGSTPLHVAVKMSFNIYDARRAKELINLGADVNAQDNEGKAPLHLIAESILTAFFAQNILELFESLIKAEVNLNIQDNDGKTPLHLAIQNNYTIAQKLIDAGANIDILDNQEQSALSSSMVSDSSDKAYNSVFLLCTRGAKISPTITQVNKYFKSCATQFVTPDFSQNIAIEAIQKEISAGLHVFDIFDLSSKSRDELGSVQYFSSKLDTRITQYLPHLNQDELISSFKSKSIQDIKISLQELRTIDKACDRLKDKLENIPSELAKTISSLAPLAKQAVKTLENYELNTIQHYILLDPTPNPYEFNLLSKLAIFKYGADLKEVSVFTKPDLLHELFKYLPYGTLKSIYSLPVPEMIPQKEFAEYHKDEVKVNIAGEESITTMWAKMSIDT